MMRLRTVSLAIAVAAIGSGVAGAAAPTVAASSRAAAPASLETLHVQGNVHLIGGAGANVTAQVGEEGVLVVDTGDGTANEALLSELRKLSAKKINHIVITSMNRDRVGGNAALAAAGANPSFEPMNSIGAAGSGKGALIHSHENTLLEISRLAAGPKAIKQDNWPNRTFFTSHTAFSYDGEPIELIHVPNATSTGDIIVFFRKSDVISAGSIFSTVSYPVIDASRGATIQGVLNGLNRIIDIAVPRINQEGGTLVIPAYGRVSNESDVVEYRDMLTIVRDRIKAMVESGATLEEVKKARPTLDYDGIYDERVPGIDWNAEKLIEAIYRELRSSP
jgi:glyoxylase-like metal-dependent hydrolase (beta-lactamase superfamily II)